ncbi:thiazole biosynthesis protein ThiJ [Brucella endophytica]|uniref:Thiazole biosynthesis protein ThiJ n=1 Tax=Brucella endophytica TaxID=1963359 RepID=A0A916SIQ3_9HYPH|nr:type 1 glutamine amidotransferase domain-containing protein [Brucella endophytica]GGB01169.1 thiazole biosynthesis protein ThiJ [Brucella endophytica]
MIRKLAAAALVAISLHALAPVGAQAANVLVVLSDENHLDLKDGKTFKTGFYLNELMQPVKMLLDAGHEVIFATPHGKAPAVDASSVDPVYFGGDADAMAEHQKLLDRLGVTSLSKSPVISLKRVEQIGYDHFDAIYIPGGHAPMQDLLVSKDLARLLTDFHEKGKATALVCHGPIALMSTLDKAEEFARQLEEGKATRPASWIYADYKFTVISNEEEEQAKPLLKGGEMKFYPQTALEQAGGRFSSNDKPWTAHMVTDREVITGQNPASARQVGEELLKRLK